MAYRENDDEQKVDIGDVVELEPQVLGDETDGCVFGGSNLVSHELRSGMTFFVARILGQWHVEEDTATGSSLFRRGLGLLGHRFEVGPI